MGSRTRKRIALVFLASAVAGGFAFASEMNSDVLVVYQRPADWQCFDEGACTRCRNVSSHQSDVIVRRGSARPETIAVPPGFTLETCREGDSVA